MPFITREDGEHFVVPSYRDVIMAKSNSLLKKEVLSLSENYGEYITLQKKNVSQYEIAFSNDTGYLLGESVWHHFNRPVDMIFCEAIPNTTEAILVIVKSGSVYLDGSFPIDSIAEELVIFLTQQNNFDIYVYGDVPISKEPADGKFSFEASSVKTFNVLPSPVFPTLPLLKIYQLQLVKTVLDSQGIGTFPLKKIVIMVVLAVAGYYFYSMLTPEQIEQVQNQVFEAPEDPYQFYRETMQAPGADTMLKSVLDVYQLVSSAPGWQVRELSVTKNVATASMATKGAKVESLFKWARENNLDAEFTDDGIELSRDMSGIKISSASGDPIALNSTLAKLMDRLHSVYPNNNLSISQFTTKGSTQVSTVKLDLQNVTPMIIGIIADQLQNLSVVIKDLNLTTDGNGLINCSITLIAVGG